MKWYPITYQEIQCHLRSSEKKISNIQKKLWDLIRIDPEKWQQSPFGEEGGGFWLVAVCGKKIIWYNDIEEGFNIGEYCHFGLINEYGLSQDSLQVSLYKLMGERDW